MESWVRLPLIPRETGLAWERKLIVGKKAGDTIPQFASIWLLPQINSTDASTRWNMIVIESQVNS
jgi:hypothetical protein